MQDRAYDWGGPLLFIGALVPFLNRIFWQEIFSDFFDFCHPKKTKKEEVFELYKNVINHAVALKLYEISLYFYNPIYTEKCE